MATCSAALKKLGAERVHITTIGHGIDRLHLHLLPRSKGTPDEVPWHAVDEWSGARGGAAGEVISTPSALRTQLAQS